MCGTHAHQTVTADYRGLISMLSWKKGLYLMLPKPLPPPTLSLSAPPIHLATLTQSALKPFNCIIKAEPS